MVKGDPCKQNHPEVSPARCRALYVHVPFCLARCRYCDFYSRVFDASAGAEYVRCARRELAVGARRLDVPLASVFVGGGTPSVLGPRLLRELLSDVRPLTDGDTEFSVEVNPGAVDEPTAAALVELGANRVNVGAQSFEPSELAVLGRIHDPPQVVQAVQILRSAGFRNVGLDLIYGIPHQTLQTWKSSLDKVLQLSPDHLSCYALSFEEGTALQEDLLAGRVMEMDEDVQRECYYTVIAQARQGGLEHYEISNFARCGCRCRHNLTYWHNEPYLGVGPSAASYLDGRRLTNNADLGLYVAAISGGKPPPASGERLTGRKLMAETLMLALRLTQGVARAEFMTRFGEDSLHAFPRSIARYAQLGALLVDPSSIRISPDFLFVADTVLADVVAEGAENS